MGEHMKLRAALSAVPFAIVALWAAPGFAQTQAMIGKWVLNADKGQGTQPASEVLTYEVKDGAEHYVADATQTDGSKFNSEYVAKFDGKEYPNKNKVTGKVNYVSLKQVFPRVEIITHIDHDKDANGKTVRKVTGRFIRIASPDGMEFTSVLLNEKGEVFSVRVFDKQPGS
jgi:hypothetical protein